MREETVPAEEFAAETGSVPFLGKQDREMLYATRSPFEIVGARPRVPTGRSDWDDQTVFIITCTARWEGLRLLALPYSDRRAELAHRIAKRLSPGQRSGPWLLEQVTTRAGHRAWQIVAARPDQLALEPDLVSITAISWH